MTVRTLRLVDSRTFAPPLITRETVPTPTPDAAATSAMVTRPDGGIRPPAHPEPVMEPVPYVPIFTPRKGAVKTQAAGTASRRRGADRRLRGADRRLRRTSARR